MVPFEMFTLGVSTLMGGALKLMGMKQEAQNTRDAQTLEILSKTIADTQNARQTSDGTKTQWTKRTLALGIVFAVIVLPKLVAAFHPETVVTFGWTEFHPGFLFFPDREAFSWMTVSGLAITPLDTNLCSAIIGFYFGHSMAGGTR